MDRNSLTTKTEIVEISNFIKNLNSESEILNFITEILTESELETLSKRWHILNMLAEGYSQRNISEKLQVSLCKVTRGSKILKNKDSVITKYMFMEKNYEHSK